MYPPSAGVSWSWGLRSAVLDPGIKASGRQESWAQDTIHTANEGIVKRPHTHTLSGAAPGERAVLWHHQVNGACPSNGMTDVSDDESGPVTGLLGVWKMGRGDPGAVVLSQTHTVAWECGNDSLCSQSHPSSCQGPIESVKLQQQVQHGECETHTHTHMHEKAAISLCVCVCVCTCVYSMSVSLEP